MIKKIRKKFLVCNGSVSLSFLIYDRTFFIYSKTVLIHCFINELLNTTILLTTSIIDQKLDQLFHNRYVPRRPKNRNLQNFNDQCRSILY